MRTRDVAVGMAVLAWGCPIGAQLRAADGGSGGAAEVNRALSAQWTISGDELRASGSRSLGEALAGRVPGLQVLMSSGALGSLPAIQLRAPVSPQTQGAPLVVIDGVPMEAAVVIDAVGIGTAAATWWKVLGDIPVSDVAQVAVVRGLASSVGYGPRAYNGAILVTTRTAGRGRHGEFRQRVGMTARASSVESRRYTLEQARAAAGANAAAGEASWRSCGGYCDLQDALFGGVRPEAATDAFGSWGTSHLSATGSLTVRRTGTATRGVSDDGLGLRGSLMRTFGSGGSVRVAHGWSRTSGARPLDGWGNALRTRPLQYLPSWLDLRGVPGLPRESTLRNPQWALDELQAPRRLFESLTSLSAVLPLVRSARHEVTATILAGLHRTSERDTARGAWMLDATGTQVADLRERWVHADLRHTGRQRGAALTTIVGLERSGQRGRAAQGLVVGAADLSTVLEQRVGTDAVMLASTLQMADGRTAADVVVRRDVWHGELSDVPAVFNWSGTLSRRLGGSRGPVARIAVASGAWRPALQVPSPAILRVIAEDRRREVELGLSGTRHGDRVRWTATLFASRGRAARGLSIAPPGGFPQVEMARLESRGVEGTATIDILRGPARAWTAEFLVSHARTRYLDDYLGRDNAGFGVARGFTRGTSMTAFVAAGGAAPGTAVGDAWPSVTYAQSSTVRLGPWQLMTRLDGTHGVAFPNWELSLADGGGWTTDTAAAARRVADLHAGGTAYVQDASWLRVREVAISRAIGRAHGPRDEPLRASLIVHNAVTLSGWRGLDPTARNQRPPGSARFDAWATYPVMRSVSVAISRPF